MPAKLIFYETVEGDKGMKFCPLVDYGCEKCFLPPVCNGENDPYVAFKLVFVKGKARMRPIEESANNG